MLSNRRPANHLVWCCVGEIADTPPSARRDATPMAWRLICGRLASALLAIVTLAAKSVLEWRYGDASSGRAPH